MSSDQEENEIFPFGENQPTEEEKKEALEKFKKLFDDLDDEPPEIEDILSERELVKLELIEEEHLPSPFIPDESLTRKEVSHLRRRQNAALREANFLTKDHTGVQLIDSDMENGKIPTFEQCQRLIEGIKFLRLKILNTLQHHANDPHQILKSIPVESGYVTLIQEGAFHSGDLKITYLEKGKSPHPITTFRIKKSGETIISVFDPAITSKVMQHTSYHLTPAESYVGTGTFEQIQKLEKISSPILESL